MVGSCWYVVFLSRMEQSYVSVLSSVCGCETRSEVACLQFDDSKIVSGHGGPDFTIKVGSCWCAVFLSSMEQSYVCALSLWGVHDGVKWGYLWL